MIAAAWTGAEYILAQSIFGQNVYTLMTVNRILHICIVSSLPGAYVRMPIAQLGVQKWTHVILRHERRLH